MAKDDEQRAPVIFIKSQQKRHHTALNQTCIVPCNTLFIRVPCIIRDRPFYLIMVNRKEIVNRKMMALQNSWVEQLPHERVCSE